MTERGIIPFDLADGIFCEECGRPKSFRLWPGTETGCKTCDKVVTRHRCTRRPDLDDLTLGESWTCPECGSTWTAVEVEDRCGECGRSGMEKGWDAVPGGRIDTAPRYHPQPFAPFRDILPRPAPVTPSGSFGTCHRTASGIMIHVKPGCRCK